jgi:hypothetical protein
LQSLTKPVPIFRINYLDKSLSRFSPRLFYYIFIPCDLISLVLQAVGGAKSSAAGNKAEVQKGVNISLAGLVFQVVILVVFCAFFADYLIRYGRSKNRPDISKRLKLFLSFLFASIVLILIRCCYRIVELHEGYFSELFRDETLFIIFESWYVLSFFGAVIIHYINNACSVMVLAVFCLTVGNPGLVFSHKAAALQQTNVSDSTVDERAIKETIPMNPVGNHRPTS